MEVLSYLYYLFFFVILCALVPLWFLSLRPSARSAGVPERCPLGVGACWVHYFLYVAAPVSPSLVRQARCMRSELNSIARLPCVSIAIIPISPSTSFNSPCIK